MDGASRTAPEPTNSPPGRCELFTAILIQSGQLGEYETDNSMSNAAGGRGPGRRKEDARQGYFVMR